MIKHREENIRAENVFIQGNYSNGKQRNAYSGILNFDSIYVKTKGSEFYAAWNMVNLHSPSLRGHIRGNIELSELGSIKPLKKKFEMGGSMQANVKIAGTLPEIKNLKTKDLKRIQLQGYVLLDNATIGFSDHSFPICTFLGKIDLHNLSDISFENLKIIANQSDLQLRGKVTNLPFFTSERYDFPVLTCKVRSHDFHFEDLFIAPDKEGRDSVKILFPDSLIVNADVSLDVFEYGKFHATDVSGDLMYKPKTVQINNFSMQTQGGEVDSDEIIVDQMNNRLILRCTTNLKHVDIGSLFYVFNEFGQTVITHEYLKGTFTGNADVIAEWDVYLNPMYNKLQVQSDFVIENGELINYQPLLGLSDYIAVEELKHIRFDNLHAIIQIRDEKATLAKTQINSSAISLTGSGEHDFDNNYKYRIQVSLADVLWKKAKKKKPENTEFGYVVDDGYGRTILPLVITGKDTVFTVSYDKKTAGDMFKEKMHEERQRWKELVSPDSSIHQQEQEFRLEWNDDSTDTKENRTHGEPDDEKRFKIEWEDE
jgi:hypothetical protein